MEKRGYPVTRQAVAYRFHAAPNAALASLRLYRPPRHSGRGRPWVREHQRGDPTAGVLMTDYTVMH